MALKELSWGRYTALFAKYDNAGVIGTKTTFAEIEDGTGVLNFDEGDLMEALEEGGGLVAAKNKKGRYNWVHTLYLKLGDVPPIQDEDGVVEGNYALWLIPENPAAPGVYLEMCTVSVVNGFTAEGGAKITYTFRALRPSPTSNAMKWYWATLAPTPDTLTFTEDADAVGKTATIPVGVGTATVSSSDSWATASITGTTVTVSVTENTGAARIATVTISRGGVSSTLTVTQDGV